MRISSNSAIPVSNEVQQNNSASKGAAQAQQAQQAPQEKFTSSIPTSPRIVSRAGEQSAATSLMKSQLLQGTDSIAQRALANGQMQTVMPSSGDNGQAHTIYINGIGTSDAGALNQGQYFANNGKAPVDVVYQHSTIADVALSELGTMAARIAVLGPFIGFSTALANARADVMKKLQNPAAANAAASQIMSQLGTPSNTNQVRLIGYSQGAAITTQALKQVSKQLTAQYGKTTADQMMSRINVFSMGGAARRSDYPPTIQLTQVFHKHDIVSQFFGDDNTSILSDLSRGTHIFDSHTNYMSDPNFQKAFTDWQQGKVNNQNIMLGD